MIVEFKKRTKTYDGIPRVDLVEVQSVDEPIKEEFWFAIDEDSLTVNTFINLFRIEPSERPQRMEIHSHLIRD